MKTMMIVFLNAIMIPFFVFSQNTVWQTTRDGYDNGTCRLVSNNIRITAHPFYADVEEEAEIMAVGNVLRGDENTLEITGTFQLTQGAALRSMLLWQGDRILKAKLKDRSIADSEYEEVVDRQRPQIVPIDPALIEHIGENQYRYKIYPVAVNGSRRLRILYSVPLEVYGCDGPSFEIRTAFTFGAEQYPNTIPIEIRKSEGISDDFILRCGDSRQTVQFGATYQIPSKDLRITTRDYFTGKPIQLPRPFYLVPVVPLGNQAYCARIKTGPAAGYYTAAFISVPDSVKSAIDGNDVPEDMTLSVTVKSGEKVFIGTSPGKNFLGVYMKSTESWDSVITWTLYDREGKSVVTRDQRFEPVSTGTEYLPLFWGAKYTHHEGLGNLGALFGFVDQQMSLLALESDTMVVAEAEKYELEGVPPLLPEEIIPDPENIPVAPRENVLFEYTGILSLAGIDATAGFEVKFADGCLQITFPSTTHGIVRIEILDLTGRVVSVWDAVQVTGKTARIHLTSVINGIYMVRAVCGDKVLHNTIVIR